MQYFANSLRRPASTDAGVAQNIHSEMGVKSSEGTGPVFLENSVSYLCSTGSDLRRTLERVGCSGLSFCGTFSPQCDALTRGACAHELLSIKSCWKNTQSFLERHDDCRLLISQTIINCFHSKLAYYLFRLFTVLVPSSS